MGKPAGIGLVPLIMVAIVALLSFLPRIDPLRKNYAAFRDWYDGFILAFVPGGIRNLHNALKRFRYGKADNAKYQCESIFCF